MKRSRYFDDMLVSALQLNYGEQTKVEGILERIRAVIQRGRVSGLGLASAPGNLLVIQPGEGYTMLGERIYVESEYTVAPPAPPSGEKFYYVYLKYKEEVVSGTEAPLYGGGTTEPTEIKDSFEVVFSETIESNPTDKILIGRIKVNSSGAILEIKDYRVDFLRSRLSVSQPSLITGVFVVDAGSQISSGTGRLELSRDSTGYRFRWKRPGGEWGNYSPYLTSDGIYRVEGDIPETYLRVNVIVSLLPALDVGGSMVEDLVVYDIYDRVSAGYFADLFSGKDLAHRLMLGSGMVTERNPHGLTLADLGERVEVLLPERVTGIWKRSNRDFLKVQKVSGLPSAIQITTAVGEDAYYVRGRRLNNISPSLINLNDIYGGDDVYEIIEVYVDENGTTRTSKRMAYRSGLRNISKMYVCYVGDIPAGSYAVGFKIEGGKKYICFKRSAEPTERVQWKEVDDNTAGYFALVNSDGYTVLVNILPPPNAWPGGETYDEFDVYDLVDEWVNLKLASVVFDAITPEVKEIYDIRRFGTTGMLFVNEDAFSDIDASVAEGYLEGMFAKAMTDGVLQGLKAWKKSDDTVAITGGMIFLKGRKIEISYNEVSGFGSTYPNGLWYVGIKENDKTVGGFGWFVTNDLSKFENQVGRYDMPVGVVLVCSVYVASNVIQYVFDERRAVSFRSGFGSLPQPIRELLLGDHLRKLRVYKVDTGIVIASGVRLMDGQWIAEKGSGTCFLIKFDENANDLVLMTGISSGIGNAVSFDKVQVIIDENQLYVYSRAPIFPALVSMSDNYHGLFAESRASGCVGVYGKNSNTSGVNYGVVGEVVSASGYGVYGIGNAGVGVYGVSNWIGIRGVATGDGTNTNHRYGIVGVGSADVSGYYGVVGVRGSVSLPSSLSGYTGWAIGVSGRIDSTVSGTYTVHGVEGYVITSSGTSGGYSARGVTGYVSHGASVTGIVCGVYGEIAGSNASAGYGVYGVGNAGIGVRGYSTGKDGVRGESSASHWAGVYGRSTAANGFGVYGHVESDVEGCSLVAIGGSVMAGAAKQNVYGISLTADAFTFENVNAYGVAATAWSYSNSKAYGVNGAAYGGGTNYGVYGEASGGDANYGVYGKARGGDVNYGVYGKAEGGNVNYAGYFDGLLRVIGSIDKKGTCNFKITHPLDPKKWLLHTSIESDRPLLLYAGSGRLSGGRCVITLPAYFEALAGSKPRHVILSCKNGWSGLYVNGGVIDGKFEVLAADGGNPEQEFDWMVVIERDDEYMRKHPFIVEVEKTPAELQQEGLQEND
jgi:hypothetical protein